MGTLIIVDATTTPQIVDFQQFRIKVDLSIDGTNPPTALTFEALCSFQLPTYEVKSSSKYGSNLYSTALCSTFRALPPALNNFVISSAVTFKVDPDDCTVAGVRFNYNTLFNGNEYPRNPRNFEASTGYLASPNFITPPHY